MLDLSAQLQNIAALPADRPMTMPGAFYTSQEQFDREAATAASHSHPTNQPTNQPTKFMQQNPRDPRLFSQWNEQDTFLAGDRPARRKLFV